MYVCIIFQFAYKCKNTAHYKHFHWCKLPTNKVNELINKNQKILDSILNLHQVVNLPLPAAILIFNFFKIDEFILPVAGRAFESPCTVYPCRTLRCMQQLQPLARLFTLHSPDVTARNSYSSIHPTACLSQCKNLN